MRPNQRRIFADSEGDQWFQRNKEALDRFDPEDDFPLRLMELYRLQPRRALEAGAATGYRLAEISKRYGTKVVGVELSKQAILHGKTAFPGVEFVQAGADCIPLEEPFDLIIVNFVFHWIDRTLLLRSAAELDRLLSDGGYLILGDFLPSNRTRVAYHHLPRGQVYTYKQDYAEIFQSCGLYHPVGLLTTGHSSKMLAGKVGEQERIGVWILQKALDTHYLETTHVP